MPGSGVYICHSHILCRRIYVVKRTKVPDNRVEVLQCGVDSEYVRRIQAPGLQKAPLFGSMMSWRYGADWFCFHAGAVSVLGEFTVETLYIAKRITIAAGYCVQWSATP